MLAKHIAFDERYDNEESGTVTLYFIAPKDLLSTYVPLEKYPDATSAEISLEFPENNISAENASVSISPTREVNGGSEDYDWNDISMAYNDINCLIELYERTNKII